MLYQISILIYILIICTILFDILGNYPGEQLKARGQFWELYCCPSQFLAGTLSTNTQPRELL